MTPFAVLGAGAAHRLHTASLRSVLYEKMPYPGGHTAIYRYVKMPPPTTRLQTWSYPVVSVVGPYLGMSPWSIREMRWTGRPCRVALSRKLWFDRADLDRLIDSATE